MKKSRVKVPARFAFLAMGILCIAGCADILKAPEIQKPTGDGNVTITIANEARTIAPLASQFSKIELVFVRLDGSGTMAPVEMSGGSATIALKTGIWEVTANAYNNATPPVVAARAKSVLVREGDEVTGNTRFVLGAAGTGQGTLRWVVTVPAGIALDAAQSRIRIRQGEPPGLSILSEPLSGTASSSFSLDPGNYTVEIRLDDAGSENAAVFMETALILPGLVTEIVYAPPAGDFLDPDVLAALAVGVFGRTLKNSSGTVIGAAGGSGTERTQALSVPPHTEAVYFTFNKTAAQTISLSGGDAGDVVMGPADERTQTDTRAVFTVDTSGIAGGAGGEKVFVLSLRETGKTGVAWTVTVTVPGLTALSAESWPRKTVYMPGDNFDSAGMELIATYSDKTTRAVNGGYTVNGFDTSAPGEQFVSITMNGITARRRWYAPGGLVIQEGFAVTTLEESSRRLFFDYGLMRGAGIVQPDRYSVPQGRALVLAPVKWFIPDTATYTWTVDNAVQGSTTEYLTLVPASQGSYAVTVTAYVNGSPAGSASTTVECVAPEGTYTRGLTGASQAASERIGYGWAPGQYDLFPTSTLLGAGGFGGYSVFKFDHSIYARQEGWEINIPGNAFSGWNEPGIVWVMQDENGNGEPDDTWYELKGSETLKPATVRRYSVIYHLNKTWESNIGGRGLIETGSGLEDVIFTGTRLDDTCWYNNAMLGYVDTLGPMFHLRDAIQVDGSSVVLAYIDFVRVATGMHYYHATGEISTEYKYPLDRTMPNPDMLVHGKDAGGGQWSYTFINNSGYALTKVTLAGGEAFALGVGATVVKTLGSSSGYIDYTGGNVAFENSNGAIVFTDAPL
jgi:hypothetical protein